MSLHIRLTEKTDLEIVLDLLSRQFKEHEIEVVENRLRYAIDAMLADSNLGFFLLAQCGESIIGLACVSFCWTLEHGGKSAWLDELYVLPEFRSHGIGSALLDSALKNAQDQGCAAVDLEVDIEHRRAESLYQCFGFQPLPRSRWVKSLPDISSER
jgi:GNAT superfamily N-acetyltransferase